MRFLFVLFGSLSALGALEIVLMRSFDHELWQTRWGKRLSVGWPVATLLVAFARFFTLGENTPLWVTQVLMALAAFLLVGLLASIMALVVVGMYKGIRKLHARVTKSSNNNSVAMNPSRRDFLKTGVSALPALAAVGSGFGVIGSMSDIRTFDLPLRFKNLPPELDGLRILHLSDLHLGPFLNLSDLESLAEDLAENSSKGPFDVVAVVGDIADDLELLPEALRIIKAIPSRYGHYATLGNHEYYRGIRQVRQAFDAGPIPLLVNEGLALTGLEPNSPNIFLGGADDPVTLGWNGDRDAFYQRAVENSFANASSEAFKLLLTHRPGAFDKAALAGIDLSLAGHTHGGQVGFLGRSMFDLITDELYLWGQYQKGESRLYTSSGVGHWFPFRLGCPAEAPTIILRRG